MLRTFQVHQQEELEESNSLWDGIMSAIRFAIRAMVHSTLQAMPMQLVFGHDAIFNIMHKTDWKYLWECKQEWIDKNNLKENTLRIPYAYRIEQQVLVKAEESSKYGTNSYLDPYVVEAINNNGTLWLNEGSISNTYNIRNVTPYN